MTDNIRIVSSSFRDPSGFVFLYKNRLYRQVNKTYAEHYDFLIKSGLYETLVRRKLLIAHKEVDVKYNQLDSKAYRIIKPAVIPFISYPYEWSFSQLKDAALVTLEIQKIALRHGMSLKDASAYNIQFYEGRPVLIDTLSFEKYEKGEPWVAYRQFCQHFVAPLALMSYKDLRLNQLFRIFIDGIPLDLASKLLSWQSRLAPSLLFHIHLHAKVQKYFSNKNTGAKKIRLDNKSLWRIIKSLEMTVSGFKLRERETEWSDYYTKTNYSSIAFAHKKEVVSGWLKKIKPKTVWDLGANVGVFSRLASKIGSQVISFDADPLAVEQNYLRCKEQREKKILPLLIDLTNPSPGIGWENKERMSLFGRGPADAVLALALVHHLAISNNVPFIKIADFFSKICSSLIIEFVPKNDSQVQRLLATRKDIFCNYKQEVFESEFQKYFTILKLTKIKDSERVLYLMKKRSG